MGKFTNFACYSIESFQTKTKQKQTKTNKKSLNKNVKLWQK